MGERHPGCAAFGGSYFCLIGIFNDDAETSGNRAGLGTARTEHDQKKDHMATVIARSGTKKRTTSRLRKGKGQRKGGKGGEKELINLQNAVPAVFRAASRQTQATDFRVVFRAVSEDSNGIARRCEYSVCCSVEGHS